MAEKQRQRRRGRSRGGNGASRGNGRSGERGAGGASARGSTGPRGSGATNGRGERVEELCELSAFSVFCALHLGITEQDGYARQDHCGVARRFGISPAELDDFLADHGLSEQALREGGFDLKSARLDIQVAPEGISRLELARALYEEALGTSD